MKQKVIAPGNTIDYKEMEKLYKTIVNRLPVGINIVQDNRFCFVNHRFQEITGYSEDELLNMDPLAIVHPEDRSKVRQHSIDMLKGKVSSPSEFRAVPKDGKEYWGMVTTTSVNYKGKQASLGNFIDITESKRAEQALAESEEKFSKALKVSGNAICITSLPDNKFVEVNEGYTHFTGYTPEEVIGRTAAELNLWVDDEELKKLQNILRKEGGFHNQEFHSRMKSGEIRIGLSSAEVIVMGGKPHRLVVIQDITESKRAEEMHAESEEKFSKVFSTSANAIGITSLADGKFVDCNEAFCRFTGYSREEIIGHNAGELNLWVKPEELANWMKTLKENGRAYNVDFTSRMKSGEIRTALASAEIINIGRNPCRIVVITDITELKIAEEKIAESEEKFSRAFRVSPDMVSITTLKGGKFIDANDRFTNATGYIREEVVGHSVIELGLWAKTEERSRMLQMLKEHGRVEGEEFDFRMKSGEIRKWLFSAVQISVNSEPCLIAMSIDITERKGTEEKIRKQNEFLSTILESITHPFYVINANDYSIMIANSATNAGDLSKKPTCYAITHRMNKPCSNTDHICPLKVMEVTRKPVVVEHLHYDKDNNVRNVEVHGYPIFDSAGNFTQMIEYSLDITERKQMEQQLKEKMEEIQAANVKLQELDKMKDSFLSTVSHELRTPLTSIKSFAEILLTYDEDKETQREFLTIINEESDRLTKLINDFLDLSKIEAGRMQWDTVELSMTPLIQNAINITQAIAKQKNLNIVFYPTPDLPFVPGDKDRLIQVITNLLSNSIKFTPDGGTITLGTRVEAAEGKPATVVVSVTDTGIGIAPENHGVVFEKFKQVGDTLTNKPKGTGLGLPICKEIVEHYGGRIWVESELGKGATFLFSLPVAAQPETKEPAIPEDQEEPVEAVKEGETVLVVDDDTNIRRFLTYELKAKGYKVFEASNGKEAIQLAREHHPDLITMDVQMPDINGFDVTTVLKNDDDTKDIPVLILSVMDDKEKAYKLGANDCLTKPFTKENLIDKVNHLLIGTKKKILVVDDDRSLVKSIKYQLEHRGYSTYVAYDGRQALETVAEHYPDLILLDIVMPNMNGYEVIKALKSRPETAGIRIVLMTGIEIDGGRVKALEVGATDYVKKSSGFNKLYETIDRILGSKTCV